MVDLAAPGSIEIMRADGSDLVAALRAGWADLQAAPFYGLMFSLVYVIGGWVMLAVAVRGMVWVMIPALVGFPILGPFIACGFYEVSRRLERGQPMVARDIVGVIWSERNRQIPMMSAVILIFFLFWNFLSHMIFALFLGTATLTNVSTSVQVFLTGPGMMMVGFGTAVGAAFSAVLFSLTVVSLPLMMDREVDFITAMLTSWRCVAAAPVVMLGWGGIIAAALGLGMATGFLGLFAVLPLFGHASWHLYRRLVV